MKKIVVERTELHGDTPYDSSVYSLWNRQTDEEQEVTKEKAEEILKSADLHSGPYGGMGSRIDLVLYKEGPGEDDLPSVLAVHYDGEWLDIPGHQEAFISHELSQNSYEG